MPERTSMPALVKACADEIPAEVVRATVDRLEERRLIFREGESLIGLALPTANTAPAGLGFRRGWAVA